jgi:hypothetical protein
MRVAEPARLPEVFRHERHHDHHAESVAERIDHLMVGVFVADDDERSAKLSEHLASDFEYINRQGVYDGADGLAEAFSHYRQEPWRHTSLRRTSNVDLHHGYFRYTWQRVEDGAEAVEGWSFGFLDDTGAIRRVVSFEGLDVPGSPGLE